MFRLYCFPGYVVAQVKYLTPNNHMEAITSARHKDSVLAHFLISTGIYIGLLVVLVQYISSKITKPEDNRSVSMQTMQPVVSSEPPLINSQVMRDTSSVASPITSEDPLPVDHTVSNSNDRPVGDGEKKDENVMHPIIAETVAKGDGPSPPLITPESSTTLAEAISKAYRKGEAVRWHDKTANLRGYAVPSITTAGTVCRNVYYSVEQEQGEWRSPVREVCE